MKVGQLVKRFIPDIFAHCEEVDAGELSRLFDKRYSKETFRINFPFCSETGAIPALESKRFWKDEYSVLGVRVRVTSQRFESNRPQLLAYLAHIDVEVPVELRLSPATDTQMLVGTTKAASSNSRYRGNAIGNAQNLFIRNILSNLGHESFNEQDWEETKRYFDNCCAYCGASGELVLEHAIPINKKALGEHRLGNLVPSCRACNARKGDSHFREFLQGREEQVLRIEEYMRTRNYEPLGENAQVFKILDMAYEEVGLLSQRYIAILDEVLPNKKLKATPYRASSSVVD